MKRLIYLLVACIPITTYGQINFKHRSQPHLLQLELAPGFYESNATIRFPFNPSTSATFSTVADLSDSIINHGQLIGLSNNISIDRRSAINIEVGYLFKFQEGLNFDITARAGYQFYFKPNMYGGVNLMASIPREVKTSFAPSAQISIGFKLPKERHPRGIVNVKRNQNQYQAFTLLGSHHTLLQLTRYSNKNNPVGFEINVATDLGYIFRHPSTPDWQSIGFSYRIPIDEYISIHPSAGFLGHVQNFSIPGGLIGGIASQIAITKDIVAKIDIRQSTKPYVRDRFQPWVYAGLGLNL